MYQMIIADDEPYIREGLVRLHDWTSWGFEVRAAFEDGDEVLAFLQHNRVDALLTDIRMGAKDGLSVAKKVRTEYPWMKVVILSGYKEFEYAKEAMHCNVFEYLLKPVDDGELRTVFGRIHLALDEAHRADALLRSVGEAEYNQLLDLIRRVSRSVLGGPAERGETWLSYAHLGPMMRSAPDSVRKVILERLVDQLRTDLAKSDLALAESFRQQLLQLGTLPADESTDRLRGMLQKLNDTVAQRQQAVPPSRDDLIVRAQTFLKTHLDENPSFKDVADHIHLSPRHFLRRFETETGETFTDYKIRVRMETAMKLLEEKQSSPGVIADAVGYKSEKYFLQQFRDYTGYTVHEYLVHSQEQREKIRRRAQQKGGSQP